MKTILLLMCLALTGCAWQDISGVDVDKAVRYCSDKGGLDYIRERFSGSTLVICADNSWIMTEDDWFKKKDSK